jgi:hypothetical protein
MQHSISDLAAVAFARGFYAAIANGRGVDDAVSSGRVGILGISDSTLEWITPVIYLRGHESRLFVLSGLGSRGASDSPSPSLASMTNRPKDQTTKLPKPKLKASPSMSGDGLFVVGLDIRPGVYRTDGPVKGRSGYYALLASTNTSDIINNHNLAGGPATITVTADVRAVEVSDCQPWHRLGDDLDAVSRNL